MIFGWRNDPRWVEHYRLRDEKLVGRKVTLAIIRARGRAVEESLRCVNQPIHSDFPGKIILVEPMNQEYWWRRLWG